MYCICCKKNNVKPLDVSSKKSDKSEEDLLWSKVTKPDGKIHTISNEMINNGIIEIIDSGYGSIHDGDQFIIAICDRCIDENLKDGTLLYWGNYMGFSDISDSDIEKSRQTFRRRCNIDKLI